MREYIFNIGFGYLLGLGVLGYVAVLYVIQKSVKQYNLSTVTKMLLIITHYSLGLLSILYVPSIIFNNNFGENTVPGGILFGLTSLLTLGLVFFIVSRAKKFFYNDR